jgi:hypothetical protein
MGTGTVGSRCHAGSPSKTAQPLPSSFLAHPSLRLCVFLPKNPLPSLLRPDNARGEMMACHGRGRTGRERWMDAANCLSVQPPDILSPPPPFQHLGPPPFSEALDHSRPGETKRAPSKGTCAHDLASGFTQTCPYKYRVCKTLKKDVPLEQKKVEARHMHSCAVLERAQSATIQLQCQTQSTALMTCLASEWAGVWKTMVNDTHDLGTKVARDSIHCGKSCPGA